MSKTNTLRIFVIHSINFIIKNLHSYKSNGQVVDVMDKFTTQLVQKKSSKWDYMRNKSDKKNNINYNIITVTFNIEEFYKMKYNMKQIDDTFNEVLEMKDIQKIKLLVDQCITHKILPSFKVIDKVVAICSQNALKDTIVNFCDIIACKYPTEYRLNSYFKHYLAEVYWLKGNITKSLKLFDEVYVSYPYLRKKVKFMMKFLIINIINQSSEGALVAVKQFTEKIAVKYQDYYLLLVVWQYCFLSDWFADQCTAAQLLEKHDNLVFMIGKKIPFLLFMSIKDRNPDILHRLMEVLLKYELKEHYSRVLQTLFDYRYRSNDLRSCSEIVQWSINLGVALPAAQQEQFLALFIGQPFARQDTTPKIKPKGDFQLKF